MRGPDWQRVQPVGDRDEDRIVEPWSSTDGGCTELLLDGADGPTSAVRFTRR